LRRLIKRRTGMLAITETITRKIGQQASRGFLKATGQKASRPLSASLRARAKRAGSNPEIRKAGLFRDV